MRHQRMGLPADQLSISRHALRYRMQRLNIADGGEGDEEPPAQAGGTKN